MLNENVFFSTDEYKDLTDEEIIDKAREGSEQALSYLLEKYKEFLKLIFFIILKCALSVPNA